MQKLRDRKDDHIFLSLKGCCQSAIDSGFDSYHFEHNALPELDFSEIDTSVKFLNKTLSIPLVISSITGGGSQSLKINRTLAKLSNEFNIGFAVGSQRAAVENPNLRDSFAIRSLTPHALLFANLGAVQLNYGFGLDQCKTAVDMLEADALMLHLNPLQEIFQKGGNKNFSGLLKKIEYICTHLAVPVIVKEVGYGISSSVAKKLYEVGVRIIDVAGAGSISWANIESMRNNDDIVKKAAFAFQDWGNPTVYAIESISRDLPEIQIIGSGGVSDGVKMAKALALGASVCGNASNFLQAAMDSEESCKNLIKILLFELKTAMFCIGAKSIYDLKKVKLNKY